MLNIKEKRFKKWLSGEITCIHCGKIYHVASFGYGKGICPDCYSKGGSMVADNKTYIVILDKSYWLNRLLMRLWVQ